MTEEDFTILTFWVYNQADCWDEDNLIYCLDRLKNLLHLCPLNLLIDDYHLIFAANIAKHKKLRGVIIPE